MTSPVIPVVLDRSFDRADGTNSSIYYNGTNGGALMLRLRCKKLEYSWEVIATESHARATRAMYPHSRAVGRFALTFEFKGYTEYKPFVDYMWQYINTFVSDPQTGNSDHHGMFVSVPVRNFNRWGIPISGIADTDHVGSMVFAPTIVFESLHDPNDPTIITPAGASTTDLAGVTGDQASFFYPFSTGSENITTASTDSLYDFGGASGSSGVSGAVASAGTPPNIPLGPAGQNIPILTPGG
jgi:hypothetical protein